MTPAGALIELVVVLGTAAAVTVVFQVLRLPVVLGYVLAGLLIGPHVPVPLVADADLVHVLSELGVILLMFSIGLELRLSAIARIGVSSALTAVFEVGFVIALGMLVARLVGFDTVPAVFVGACLGISSTMLVAKAFEERGWTGGFTEIVFAILVFEDLIAILLLAVLAAVGSGAELSGGEIALVFAKLAGFFTLMIGVGLLVVPRFIRWIDARAHAETLAIAALAICFATAALTASFGYSVALGAFAGGILIAESGRGHRVFVLVKPFRDVFAMVFFVSIGMTIDPERLAGQAPWIAVFTVVVLLAKPFAVSIAVFLAGRGVQPAVRSGLSLAQVGELSFVIASAAPASTEGLLALAVGVCCATTITSSVLVRNSERIAGWVASRLPGGIATFVSFYEAWLVRLRRREVKTWRRLRRTVVILVLDVAAVVGISIAGATVGHDVLAEVGISGTPATALQLATVCAVSAVFVFGIVRRIATIARELATEVIPFAPSSTRPPTGTGAPIDLGRAPRRTLVVMLEIALAATVIIPAVALVQPFVPASPVLLVVVVLVLLGLFRRSLADFSGHVRAGSELILELLEQPAEPSGPSLANIEDVLPGFGGLQSIRILPGSPAIGRSLAELDLRARTGATVLAIASPHAGTRDAPERPAHGLASPSPTEPLREGDVLALAGSDDAIAAARTLLDTHGKNS